jgi:DNA-binding MarR family transcriptional regulator
MAAHGVQGRAVLIDVAYHLDNTEEWTAVPMKTVREIMAADKVEVRPGDMVIIHTGFTGRSSSGTRTRTRRGSRPCTRTSTTFARYELLVRLYFRDRTLPLNQLGRQLQIHQTSITSLVDRLENQGLIKRTPHPSDRRSTLAQMTPAGRVLTRKAIKLLNSELFGDLGLSGREAHLLIGLLMKMRRSWNDIENPEGWEQFEAGLDR